MSQTQTNTKYKEIKKSIEDADYYVDEEGDYVSTINNGSYDIGLINHIKNVVVVVDVEEDHHVPVIEKIVKDAGIPCRYASNIHDRVIDAQIKNLRDEVVSLREKLSQKITA